MGASRSTPTEPERPLLRSTEKPHHGLLGSNPAVWAIAIAYEFRSAPGPQGRKGSNKYALVDELGAHYAAGRSILVYQHFPRHVSRAEVLARARDRLATVMPEAKTISLRTPFAAFILAIKPEHQPRLEGSLAEMKRRDWRLRFFDVCASPFGAAH